MKIVVTGASGFIGRHVLVQLANRNLDVTAVVRNPPPGGRLLAATRTVQLDVHARPQNVFDALGQPDVVIHLAWSGLPHYKSLHHFEQELPLQYRWLKALIDGGLKSLVVAGTCFEYGMQAGELLETALPRPSNPYGFAKNALREQLTHLQATHAFHLTWVRLFYLYGEGQARNSLWSQLQEAVNRRAPHFDMSEGEQLRDYLDVTEAAKYLIDLALLRQNAGIVNVCSGRPISVRKLVEGWIQKHQWSIIPRLGYHSYPEYEPMAFWGNSDKLLALIGEKA